MTQDHSHAQRAAEAQAAQSDSARAAAPAAEPIALLQIEETTIALPSAVVREVIGWPAHLTPASADGALLGYFPLREDALPLYDLPSALSLRERSAGRMVAIVDVGLGRVGLAIDAAKGFSTLDGDRLSGLSRREVDVKGATYKLFNDPKTAEVTIYLDHALLMELPGMAVAASSRSALARSGAGAKARRGGACDTLSFKWRDLSLAVDVRYVQEIVATPPFEKLRLMSDLFLGQARIREEDVAIVDVDVLLKRPKGPEVAPPIVLFLDVDGRRFGVPATQVVQLADTRSVERAPFPAEAERGDVVCAALVSQSGERFLELDARAIAEHREVSALAEKLNAIKNRSAEAVASKAEASAGAGGRLAGYIKLAAGGAVYADLRNLLQLLELQPGDLYLKETRDELAGFITYRGQVVPVLDLARHLGAAPALSPEALNGGAPIRVALAKSAEAVVGMIVDGFDSIEHLSVDRGKRHLSHQAELEDVSAVCRPATCYLTAHDRSGSKTIKFIDLEVVAKSFKGASSAAPGGISQLT